MNAAIWRARMANFAWYRGTRRLIVTEPDRTAYYTLVVDDMDKVLGAKRVESSRMEAAMRRIAQKLFLHDEAQQALLEEEIRHDESQFIRGQRPQYLRDFADARDIAPRPLPTSQTRLAKELREILQSGVPTVVQDVAHLLWKHPIRRKSTFQMVAREFLRLGHREAAQHVMESLLMAIKNRPEGDASGPASSAFDKPLGSSVYALCLEVAMANSDHAWFMDLSRAARSTPAGSTPAGSSSTEVPNKAVLPRALRGLQQKFSLEYDPTVELLLAEGFMKFGHPHLLNEVLQRNKPIPPRKSSLYVKLLAVSMETAYRFQDATRAMRTFTEFSQHFDPDSEGAVRFLLLARKHEATRAHAVSFVPKLTPAKQKLYRRKESVWQYVHPYANPDTKRRTNRNAQVLATSINAES